MVHNYPYLGVIIFNDLSWTNYVNNVKSKAIRTLGMLRRSVELQKFSQEGCLQKLRSSAAWICMCCLGPASSKRHPGIRDDTAKRCTVRLQRLSSRRRRSDRSLVQTRVAHPPHGGWATLHSPIPADYHVQNCAQAVCARHPRRSPCFDPQHSQINQVLSHVHKHWFIVIYRARPPSKTWWSRGRKPYWLILTPDWIYNYLHVS